MMGALACRLMQAIEEMKGPGWWLDYLPQVPAHLSGGLPRLCACVKADRAHGLVNSCAIIQVLADIRWHVLCWQVTARWLGSHVLSREAETDPTLLADFLLGSSEAGHVLSAEFYGCLQVYRSVGAACAAPVACHAC